MLEITINYLKQNDFEFLDNISDITSMILMKSSNNIPTQENENQIELPTITIQEFDNLFYEFLKSINAPKSWEQMYDDLKTNNRISFEKQVDNPDHSKCYRDDNNILRLKGSQFWNIPYNDLEEDVHQVWEKTKAVISNGLKIEVKNGRKCNNLPKQSENRVCHVRPHAKNSSDTYELPDGRHYPKQCFWHNNSYIYSQLNESLK